MNGVLIATAIVLVWVLLALGALALFAGAEKQRRGAVDGLEAAERWPETSVDTARPSNDALAHGDEEDPAA